MATKTLMTGEDLLRMPDCGNKYELVRGELIEMSPPGMTHGKCAARISRLLDEFVEAKGLGQVGVESGFYLARNPDTVRGPDIFFISKERFDPAAEVEGYSQVVADLVVEVLSPKDTFQEVNDKINEYLAAGVRLVWVVDPTRRTVTIYPGARRLTETDTLTGGDVLPGFSVPVSRLFPR